MDLPLGLCEGVRVYVHDILCMTMLSVTTGVLSFWGCKLESMHVLVHSINPLLDSFSQVIHLDQRGLSNFDGHQA